MKLSYLAGTVAGMKHEGLYESAIGSVVAILFALAAERFRTSRDNKDRGEQQRTAAYVLAGASMSVTAAFGAPASGAETSWTRVLVLSPLALAWLVLKAPYWTSLEVQFHTRGYLRVSTRWVLFTCLFIALFVPMIGALALIVSNNVVVSR